MTTNTQDNTQVTLTDVKNVGLGAVINTLNAVGNTARFLDHSTGILADKAENYREQIKVQDAIAHNKLMTQYVEEAQAAGLDVSHITW